MKYLAISFIALNLIGCSHRIETVEHVSLPFATELVKSIQQSNDRQPASFDLEVNEEKSTRRVYFSSLYHQYLSLGQFLKIDSTLGSCPQFHHDKIETDSFTTPVITSINTSQIKKEEKHFFPELAFTKKFSLNDHHEVLREELDILCEEGLSDNFYKFDNLVTNYAGKKSFHLEPQAMAAVLKIPVFANYYLLKMLQNNEMGFQFTFPEEKRFIKMTNTTWFEKYVSEASKVRHSLLKNKMVKR